MTRRWSALGVLALGVLLIGVDGTVLAVAAPLISRDLGATATQMLWIGDIYSFVLAGLLITMGGLGDRIGHKKLLLGAAFGFAVMSIATAYAPTPELLIGARALLGVAGATLAPSTLALIRALFPIARERSVAVGIWAAVFSAGTALGPVVGGLLLEHFWWGSVFLINVPVIAVLLVGGIVLLPEMRDPTPGPRDLPSVGLSLVGMLGLVYALKEGVHDGLHIDVVVVGLVGISALTLFVRRQLRLPDPLIDIRLFYNPTFSGVVAANLLSVLGLSGVVFFLSQYFQLVNGYSPAQAGLAELPAAVAAMVSRRRIGPVGPRFRCCGRGGGRIGLVVQPVSVAVGRGSGFTGRRRCERRQLRTGHPIGDPLVLLLAADGVVEGDRIDIPIQYRPLQPGSVGVDALARECRQ
jgi:MFS transporter, DHA2 family, multidrug resistance protein